MFERKLLFGRSTSEWTVLELHSLEKEYKTKQNKTKKRKQDFF